MVFFFCSLSAGERVHIVNEFFKHFFFVLCNLISNQLFVNNCYLKMKLQKKINIFFDFNLKIGFALYLHFNFRSRKKKYIFMFKLTLSIEYFAKWQCVDAVLFYCAKDELNTLRNNVHCGILLMAFCFFFSFARTFLQRPVILCLHWCVIFRMNLLLLFFSLCFGWFQFTEIQSFNM